MTSIDAGYTYPQPLPTRTTLRDVVTAVVTALHEPDEVWARRHQLTVERVGGARIYRDPRFDGRVVTA